MSSVFTSRGSDTRKWQRKVMWGHDKKAHICKPRKETSDTKPAALGTVRAKFMLFKPASSAVLLC